jgi:hypothetical protein
LDLFIHKALEIGLEVELHKRIVASGREGSTRQNAGYLVAAWRAPEVKPARSRVMNL